MKLEFDLSDKYDMILPSIEEIDKTKDNVKRNWWKIDQTISELSYLTHGFFRYYGKFPPTIASFLLNKYPCPPNGGLLDNFAGSGTSLVEASRRGIPAVGIDINPIACLSGVVKTTLYNTKKLRLELKQITDLFNDTNYKAQCEFIPSSTFLEKWFFKETVNDIIRIKAILLELKSNISFDFFSLAFLSVIRRLSKAYDGEVRPHVNKNKNAKDPFCIFQKKVREMILSIDELKEDYPQTIASKTLLIDTRQDYSPQLPDLHYWLIISHPPYLNCFDYIAVYKLELEWSLGFENLWSTRDLQSIKKLELKSWPAKENIIQSYYEGLKLSYQITHKIQKTGDKLAVVIGDCSIQGKLEPVHLKLIDIIQNIGYNVLEINYRTTNYTTGKYAYKERADYDQSEKRDAIIIFEKQ